ncbi:hypothetical protein [Pseudanabaena yagii]|nr:hypothetical protein [Pseudanabaena yagii]
MREQSLFGVGNRRSGLLGLMGDRCLMWGNRRSGFMGGERRSL